MNTKNFREIEKKLVIQEDYIQAIGILKRVYSKYTPLDCVTYDTYWECPGKAQFVRLRDSKGTMGKLKKSLEEVTVKSKDHATNTNRQEVNIHVIHREARVLLEAALGKELGQVNKSEIVYFLPGSLVVSLCDIFGGKVYVEVEAPSLATVNREIAKLKKYFKGSKREPRSLFEIYVQKKGG